MDTTPAEEPTTPEPAKPETTFKKPVPIWLYVILFGGLLLVFVSQMVAGGGHHGHHSGAYAPNETISRAYGIEVIDNKNFSHDNFITMNKETRLVDICQRPTLKEVEEKVKLECKTPL